VCVGDSFTEGMSDDLRPDGHHIGWSDRVATALACQAIPRGEQVWYANLAVRGKLLDRVVDEQVPTLPSLQPTIVTFHAGPNDVLRRGTDLADLDRRYDAAVRSVVASGARVMLFTSISRAGGTGRLAQVLAERFARFNGNVRAVGERYGATVVDLEPVDSLTDRRLWHSDRLHLNSAGHRRVAAAVLEGLGITDADLLDGPTGWWRVPLPPKPPTTRRQDVAADLAWARDHLAPWLGRRLRGTSSGDGREAKDPVLRLIA
jgi:lysophospholipase L1-like esterase